jgi:hypothetical protein
MHNPVQEWSVTMKKQSLAGCPGFLAFDGIRKKASEKIE